jgi:sulfonate transport system ATP-binding protein
MNIGVLDRSPDLAVRFSTTGSSVRLRGLTKSFGQQTVLHGIDLDIPASQFVAIVGRSGCGSRPAARSRSMVAPAPGAIMSG